MKQFIILLLLIPALATQAQSGQQSKSVNFCFRQMTLPPECNIESEYQIKTDQATLSWIYVAYDNMIFAANGLIKKLETYPEFTRERTICYLLNHEVTAYRVSFKKDSVRCYQIIAYGNVNNQAVIVQLTVKKEPRSNEDIPPFAHAFIRF